MSNVQIKVDLLFIESLQAGREGGGYVYQMLFYFVFGVPCLNQSDDLSDVCIQKRIVGYKECISDYRISGVQFNSYKV